MGASQLEVDNADLRFVCSQQSERVRLLEAELAHVHSALEESMAGSGTILPAAHKSPLVGQQEHMQAYAPVAPREPPPPLADEAAGSCYSADAQLALVARQLRAARAEVAEARARAREAEEGRGGGGGGGDASARDDAFGCGGGDGALEQLRHQVDFLNARCVSLEAQLREHRNPPGWEKKQAELRASKRDAAALSERLVKAEQERDDLRRRLSASATSRAQERDGPRRAAGRAERGRAERGASEAALAEELAEARREGERMEQLLEAERAATAALRARAGESKTQGDEVAACRALLLETEAREELAGARVEGCAARRQADQAEEAARDELEARLKSCEGSLASARRLVEGEQASLQLAKQQELGKQQEVERLKALVQRLDAGREELATRLKESAGLVRAERGQAEAQAAARLAAEQALLEKDAAVAQLRQTVAVLDEERDALVAEVDEKAEELHALGAKLGRASEAAAAAEQLLRPALDRAVAESEQRGKQLSQAAAERDALIAQLGESQGLAGRLRDEARTREAALAATSEDLRQMIRENQLVNDESQSSAAAAAQMRRELDEARENSVFLQQVVQAFEAEKEELLEAYTRLGEEASAAQSSSHALEAECDTLRKYAHGVEQALKAATEHAIAQENAVAMALSAGLTESHLSRAVLHDNTNGVESLPAPEPKAVAV